MDTDDSHESPNTDVPPNETPRHGKRDWFAEIAFALGYLSATIFLAGLLGWSFGSVGLLLAIIIAVVTMVITARRSKIKEKP